MRKNTQTKKSTNILIPRKMIDCIEVADQNTATPPRQHCFKHVIEIGLQTINLQKITFQINNGCILLIVNLEKITIQTNRYLMLSHTN